MNNIKNSHILPSQLVILTSFRYRALNPRETSSLKNAWFRTNALSHSQHNLRIPKTSKLQMKYFILPLNSIVEYGNKFWLNKLSFTVSGAVLTIKNDQQDRQYAYNATLRHVLANFVAVKNYKFYISWACVCSLRYAMRVHHIVICGLPGSKVFFHITS